MKKILENQKLIELKDWLKNLLLKIKRDWSAFEKYLQSKQLTIKRISGLIIVLILPYIFLATSFINASLLLTLGLSYYLGIFLILCIVISFKFNIKRWKNLLELTYISATIIILFTSVFAVIANERKNELIKNESDLNFKTWLCMEYQNNINTTQETVDQYNTVYLQLTEQETNTIKEMAGLNQPNLQCEIVTPFNFLFLNQHFRSYALKKYFEDNLNLFPDSKINDALDLDYVMVEIAEDKLIEFNNLNSLAISIGTTEKELPESFIYQRKKIFFDLKYWAESKLKERLEQRKIDMNCPN